MLLFTTLVETRNPRTGGEMTQLLSDMLDDHTTDAERAGERLLVVGTPLPGGRRYRVVGHDTGTEYVRVAIHLPAEADDTDHLALERLGLIIQMCLNGAQGTPESEVRALQDLSDLDAATAAGESWLAPDWDRDRPQP